MVFVLYNQERCSIVVRFFFQAEDGIRDPLVTGVQTCALPISKPWCCGPVITGVNWYSSFDAPDKSTGLVEIAADATVRGGHEIVAEGIDAENELVWFWNSWGTVYALGGRFCMSFDTWDPPAARAGRRHGTAGLTGLRRFHDRGGLASARVRDAETTAIMNVSAATGAAGGPLPRSCHTISRELGQRMLRSRPGE